MIFKSKYCAECGCELEDSKSGIFTASKFCQACKPAFRKIELLSRFGSAALAGCALLLGAGAYLGSQQKGQIEIKKGELAATAPATVTLKKVDPADKLSENIKKSEGDNAAEGLKPDDKSESGGKLIDGKRLPSIQIEAADGDYTCSARTSKGTPCTRKVKKGLKCWQHAGKQAKQPEGNFKTQ
jgi:hypothetical protein